MNHWKDFIQSQTLNDWDMIDADENAFCALDYFGIIQVSGDDACTFLHNISSNNFNTLKEQQSSMGSFCNSKGRVLASFIATKVGETFYLCMPSDLIEPIIKHLTMFVLMSKVKINDVSNQYLGIGITDKCDFDKLDIDNAIVLPYFDNKRIQIYVEKEHLDNVWQKLLTQYTPTQSALWKMSDIRAGLTWVYQATSAKIVPQTLNLDLIGSVDFDKGCYPGQEVVARMHYLGKSKRRTYLFSSDAGDLECGTDIHVEGADTPCGTVIDFCSAKPRSYGLVAMMIKHRDDSLTTSSNQSICIESDPYPVTK